MLPAGKNTRSSGFTLVELIVTIILLGIMSAVAIPRLANRLSYDTRGFADQSLAAVQYARKVAMAAQRNVCVNVAGGEISLTMAQSRGHSQSCSPAVSAPDGDSYVVNVPDGVQLGGSTSLQFDAEGNTAGGQLTVTGDSTFVIRIEASGHAYITS